MRVLHCCRTPPGWTPDAPEAMPVRSRTTTVAPRSRTARAAARPVTPAPTTATSGDRPATSTWADDPGTGRELCREAPSRASVHPRRPGRRVAGMAVLDASARELIGSGALAHLATVDRDGSPHVTVVWAGVDGDDLVVASLGMRRKLRNVRRDPR